MDCCRCERTFSSQQRLKYHIDHNVCINNKECKKCKKTFNSRQKLNNHIEKNICMNKTCEYCDKIFSSTQRLQTHKEKCNYHFCGNKEWHNKRCTDDYDLTDVICYDCGDLMQRCCKDKYIEKCIKRKKEIDESFVGDGYFDNKSNYSAFNKY